MNRLGRFGALGMVVAMLMACNMGSPRETSTAGPTAHDQDFVRTAAESGMAEVELSQLALERAEDSDVREFAERMLRDHSRAVGRLMRIAAQEGMSMPLSLAPEHARLGQELAALSGAEFDRRYMEAQVAEHQRAVEVFQNQGRSAASENVQHFATTTLPSLQTHLQRAQETASRLANMR